MLSNTDGTNSERIGRQSTVELGNPRSIVICQKKVDRIGGAHERLFHQRRNSNVNFSESETVGLKKKSTL